MALIDFDLKGHSISIIMVVELESRYTISYSDLIVT